MADNRMLLVHRPTGLAIILAKKLAGSWYSPATKSELGRLFKEIDERYGEVPHNENASIDDFCIGMEDCGESCKYVVTDIGLYHADKEEPRLLQTNKMRLGIIDPPTPLPEQPPAPLPRSEMDLEFIVRKLEATIRVLNTENLELAGEAGVLRSENAALTLKICDFREKLRYLRVMKGKSKKRRKRS